MLYTLLKFYLFWLFLINIVFLVLMEITDEKQQLPETMHLGDKTRLFNIFIQIKFLMRTV